MTVREWYYWHVIRAFGPMNGTTLWGILWGDGSPNRGREWSKRTYGFLPRGCNEDCRTMQLKGYLRNLNEPNAKGRIPVWEAV